MNMPDFTAEASLYRARRTYHVTSGPSEPSGMIQPASLFNCVRLCQGDPDCVHCCLCIGRGGKPSHCCF